MFALKPVARTKIPALGLSLANLRKCKPEAARSPGSLSSNAALEDSNQRANDTAFVDFPSFKGRCTLFRDRLD